MVEIIGYQTVLMLHIVAFFSNVILVVLSDVMGLAWVFGRKRVLNPRLMYLLHRLIWVGLLVSVSTGLVLFSKESAYLLGTPAFLVKVGLVMVLIINSFVISHHIGLATQQSFSQVNSLSKRIMIVSGMVSVTCWIGIVVAATQIGL